MIKLKIGLNFWSIVLLVIIFLPPFQSLNTEPRQTSFKINTLPDLPFSEIPSKINLEAKYFTSVDVSSGEQLMSSDSKHQHPPASTAKLMLASVVRDHCALDRLVTISQPFNIGTVINVKVGQKFSIQDMLYGLLLPSANDIAINLAAGCFGTVDQAVSAMNVKASSWHLNDTHFTNPTGLDEDGNYTSADDLATLAILSTQDSLLAQIVSTQTKTIISTDGQKYDLISTNKLLDQGFDGIKTGQTLLAGGNLVASTNINGHRVVTVVLGSENRFAETEKLVTELTRIYRWQVEPDGDLRSISGGNNPIK